MEPRSRGTITPVEQDHYTTGQAAKILKVTDRYICKLINAGELEAVQDEKGRHHIPQRAVHAMLEARRAEESQAPPGDIDTRDILEALKEASERRRRVEDER